MAHEKLFGHCQVGATTLANRAVMVPLNRNRAPGHVADVQEIIMVVPTRQGVFNPLVLSTTCVAGVIHTFTVGGDQAVGR